jgi:glutamine synthetase
MARTQIYPAVMAYLGQLASSLHHQESLALPCDRGLASNIANLNQQLLQTCTKLEEAITNPPHGDVQGHMNHCANTLLPLIESLREAVDSLEALVDDAIWPLPTYQEMLFIK